MNKKKNNIIKGQILWTIISTIIFLLLGLFIEFIINFFGRVFGVTEVIKDQSLNQNLGILLSFCALTISIFVVFKSMLDEHYNKLYSTIKIKIEEQISNSLFIHLLSQNSSDTSAHRLLLEQLNSYLGIFNNTNKYYKRAFSILSKNMLIQLEEDFNKLITDGIDIPLVDSPLFSERLILNGNEYTLIERFSVIPSRDFTEGYYSFLNKLSQNDNVKKRFIFIPNPEELIKQFSLNSDIGLIELEKFIKSNIKQILSTYKNFFKEMQKLNFETYFCNFASLSLELGQGIINETIEIINNELLIISSLPSQNEKTGNYQYKGEDMNVQLKLLANTKREKYFMSLVEKFKIKY